MRLTLFLVQIGLALAVVRISYFPDDYFRICQRYLATNAAVKAQCTAYTAAGDISPCYCENDNLARSVYQCIATFSSMSSDKNAVEHSFKRYHQFCRSVGTETMYTLQGIEIATQNNPVNQTFEQASTSLSGAFLLKNSSYTMQNVLAGEDYYWQLSRGDLFGYAVVCYIFGIMALQVLLNFLSWCLPLVFLNMSNTRFARLWRQYFTLPLAVSPRKAAGGKWASALSITIPPRVHAVLCFGLFVLTTILSAYNYPVYTSPMLRKTHNAYIGMYVAYRTGVILMYLMPPLFLFGGRNNILIWLTGWSYEIFNFWHRWIARLWMILLIIHTIFWSWDLCLPEVAMLSELSEPYVVWGWLGLAAAVIMMVFSIKQVRAVVYETFVFLHIFLGVWVVVGTYYHIIARETGLIPFYFSAGIWILDRVIRLFKIWVSNFGLSKANVVCIDDEAVEMTIHYSGSWAPAQGSYVFVSFMTPSRFWQSHPFTVTPVPGNRYKLRLVAKVHSGLTRYIHSSAKDNGGSCKFWTMIEGPYGSKFNTELYDELVFFAGGVGFAAVLSHVYPLITGPSTKLITIHLGVRHVGVLKWFEKDIKMLQSCENVDLYIYVTNDPSAAESSDSTKSLAEKPIVVEKTSSVSYGQRLDAQQLVTAHAEQSRGPIMFFVCGPESLAQACRQASAAAVALTRNHVQFYEESFTM